MARRQSADIITDQKTAAEKLGVTDRALRLWLKEPGFPDCSAGYDIPQIKAWREQHGKKGSTEAKYIRKLKARTLRQQLRIKTAEADSAEREQQAALGNILSREAYELYLVEVIQKARDRLLRLSRLLCRCVPKKFHPTLMNETDSEVRKILGELARDFEKGPDKRDLKKGSAD